MTILKFGFLLESLSLTGAAKPPAELTFVDGLNVITGASDTGKSYALGCIDYAFGASAMTRTIPQADGYTAVVLKLRERSTAIRYEVTRGLSGGGVRLREFEPSGELRNERAIGARHDPDNPDTLSGLYLALSGLAGRQVRKNQRGELRNLSFRDVAFLIALDEERMISERPPHLSGSFTDRTVEGATLRLLATGNESSQVFAVPKKQQLESARAQLDLVQQMIAQVTAEIERLSITESDLEPEVTRIEQARNAALESYEGARTELADLEARIGDDIRALREVDSRALVVQGLMRRFELLSQHYDSDVARLEAVEEAGTLLESFPAGACPVCGASPKEHRGPDAEGHFRLEDVRAAARGEAAKISALQADLAQEVGSLSDEIATLEARRSQLKHNVSNVQTKINSELQPRLRASANALKGQTERRDILLRARTLIEQRDDLRRREAELDRASKVRSPKEKVVRQPTTAELDEFALSVQALLREWNYPDAGRVVFSEAEQDLVIGGQPRGSHGKGVRALCSSAFITGLMKHCIARQLPHPGVVLLDSPLVVYREPDVQSDAKRIRQAGVKEAFYRSLAAGAAGGQVIIFENEDPPSDLQVHRHHFSKAGVGRYGFVPV